MPLLANLPKDERRRIESKIFYLKQSINDSKEIISNATGLLRSAEHNLKVREQELNRINKLYKLI